MKRVEEELKKYPLPSPAVLWFVNGCERKPKWKKKKKNASKIAKSALVKNECKSECKVIKNLMPLDALSNLGGSDWLLPMDWK